MAKRPNFLVILADDLGFTDLGCFGSEIKTPNIDSIAKDGLRFTDFHAAAACSPTRSMLLSGTDNHIAGIGTMAERASEFQKKQPGYEGYLNDRIAALPEVLSDAGYLTLMSGKWHLGLTKDRWPCTRGFKRSFSLLPGAANHYGWEPQLLDAEVRPRFMLQTSAFYVEDDKNIHPSALGKEFYSSETFTDKLLQYLDERTEEEREQPFFSYLAYSAPHWPLQAPEKDIADYNGVYDDGPEVLHQKRVSRLKELGLIQEDTVPHEPVVVGGTHLSKEWESQTPEERAISARTMEAYAGMVQNMDTNIGRVLDKLHSTGELDNTFVLFMSDNGAEGILLESFAIVQDNIHNHIKKYYDNSLDNIGRPNSYVWYGPRWASASAAPSRLYKSFTTEGGIRVPFVLRYPPLTDALKTHNNGIHHPFTTVMDLMPTFLDLAGTTHPGQTYRGRNVVPMRGTSWLPYLKSPESNPNIHADTEAIGWELFGRAAIRKGKYKAVYVPPPYGPGYWQLYDVVADAGETRDLKDGMPEKLEELIKEWDAYVEEVGMVGDAPQIGILKVEEVRH